MNTKIVVPLIPMGKAPLPAKRLNPVFDIDGASYVKVTQFMAAVPAAMLKTPVAHLAVQSDDIVNALDMVFFGF